MLASTFLIALRRAREEGAEVVVVNFGWDDSLSYWVSEVEEVEPLDDESVLIRTTDGVHVINLSRVDMISWKVGGGRGGRRPSS